MSRVMSNLAKLFLGSSLLALFSIMPLTAQIDNTVVFNTPFPFYVNQTRMPAGSYALTQASDLNLNLYRIESKNGLHSALFAVLPADTSLPENQTRVIFKRYGNTLYFSRALAGESTNSGLKIVPTNAMKRAEETASVVGERSIIARHG
jgi:hypothetical protein